MKLIYNYLEQKYEHAPLLLYRMNSFFRPPMFYWIGDSYGVSFMLEKWDYIFTVNGVRRFLFSSMIREY